MEISLIILICKWYDFILTYAKNFTKKLLDIINTFYIVVGYTINIWKSTSFLYTNHEWTEKDSRRIIPFTIASKKKKERKLGIHLMKEQKTSKMKTADHWIKESKKTLDYRKTSHVHGMSESILWKWLYYQKQSTYSMKSPPKFQWHSSHR
jgi:hypothetical protein